MKVPALPTKLVSLTVAILAVGCSKPPPPSVAKSPVGNVPAQTSTDFFSALAGQLVIFQKDAFVPYVQTGPRVAFTAIYYSAHWCPPCRAFTPKLVEWYKDFKPKHPNFELIFVSRDKDEAAQVDYMKETGMPWPAVKLSESKEDSFGKYAADGIPYLVLIDSEGKDLTGKPGNDWQPPAEVLKKIEGLVK